jgi:hypothetical protein
MKASKARGQRGPPKKSQPLDPVDLSRRLNIVIAERQLEDLQLSRRLKESEPDLPNARCTHDVHTKKTAPHTKDNKRSSPPGAPKTSIRWVFRTKPATDHSPHDSTGSSATYVHGPRDPHTSSTRRQPGARQEREGQQQAEKFSLVLNERASEPGRGPSGDAKELCHPDWTHGGLAGPKSRRLQLFKRMSPIAVLKLRLGGDGPESEVSKAARPGCDTVVGGGQVVVNRKSGVFSKLLAH